jgi:transposase
MRRFVSCVRFEVVTLPEARHGFVWLPKRWVVERSFGRAERFRRLARDEEQLAETLVGWHFVAFAILMLRRFVELLV